MTHGNGLAQQSSVAELVKRLGEQTSELARKEVELAKAELGVKGKQIGLGAGAFGGAGLLALFAFGALTAALILALAEAVEPWLAALIVATTYAAIAGVAALVGRKRVEAGTPPLPEQAVESSKEDVQWAKQSARRGRL